MEKKEIEVKRNAVVVDVSKIKGSGYSVRAGVTRHSFDTYMGFDNIPTIRGRKVEVGSYIRKGQVIRG